MSAATATTDVLDPSNSSKNTLKIENVRAADVISTVKLTIFQNRPKSETT